MPQTTSPQPKVRWRKLLVKGALWMSAEIVLGVVGLDNVADYSEFLSQSHTVVTHITETVSNLITMI